ncbi:hypothetical protein [Saccharopolyspora sp. NPDC002376]
MEVVADEPTEAPMRDKSGAPIFWQQTRTLLLADGSTVYGCAHCEYTNPNPRSIRPHLNIHRDRKPAPAAGDPIRDLLARLAEVDKLTADRDQWRRRALDAERDLRAIRKALRGTS